MIAPDRSVMRLSSAGHLRPVLAVPGRRSALIEMPVDVPLGVAGGRSRRTTVVDLPPQALMLCYTDGLIERRNRIIDAGIEALVRVVRAGPAEAVCATVMSRLGDDSPPTTSRSWRCAAPASPRL
jgi:phosphoserine phosphatase RsbU/P